MADMLNGAWIGSLALCMAAMLVPGCSLSSDPATPDPKLYVFDCGGLKFDDPVVLGLRAEDTDVRELANPCYLIVHANGTLIWDAGLPAGFIGQGDVAIGPGVSVYYDRSMIEQLAETGYAPTDIDYLALSHLHFDHAGLANAFATSTHLIQKPEHRAGFLVEDRNPYFNYALYNLLADSETVLLEGDYDVFGDGTVRLIRTPGHTPGHQVLLVTLANTGPVLLTGDLYHIAASRRLRAVSSFNTDIPDTYSSMDRVEALIESTGAQIWIAHDKAIFDEQRLAPDFYD